MFWALRVSGVITKLKIDRSNDGQVGRKRSGEAEDVLPEAPEKMLITPQKLDVEVWWYSRLQDYGQN